MIFLGVGSSLVWLFLDILICSEEVHVSKEFQNHVICFLIDQVSSHIRRFWDCGAAEQAGANLN